MSRAATDIAEERRRQVAQEGHKPDHDDEHGRGEIEQAAAAYAWQAGTGDGDHMWPWEATTWKPTNARRDLVKAGALIVAAIERIDRIDAKKKIRDAARAIADNIDEFDTITDGELIANLEDALASLS